VQVMDVKGLSNNDFSKIAAKGFSNNNTPITPATYTVPPVKKPIDDDDEFAVLAKRKVQPTIGIATPKFPIMPDPIFSRSINPPPAFNHPNAFHPGNLSLNPFLREYPPANPEQKY